MLESKLFFGFTSKECNQFIEYSKPTKKELKKEEVLTDEGVIVDNFAILLSGRLKGAKYRYDGTLDLIEMYSSSDVINLETICTPTRISPVQISAMENSTVLVFDRRIIEDERMPVNIRHRIQSNIINILANENIKKLYKIDVLYKKSLRQRILVFLKHMETRLGTNEFNIRMDREQFAQYLGVNRSALSHELSLMKAEGIIEFRKDHFKILSGEIHE